MLLILDIQKETAQNNKCSLRGNRLKLKKAKLIVILKKGKFYVKYALEEVMIYIRMSVVTSQMKRSILIDGNAVGITIKSWLKEIVDQNCIHFQIIFHI